MIRLIGFVNLGAAVAAAWIGTTIYYLWEWLREKDPWAGLVFGVQTGLIVALVMVIHG